METGKMAMGMIVKWAYTAFVIIAIVAGLVVGYMMYNGDAAAVDANAWVLLILMILGLVIGLTSITLKEVTPFLIATIALLVAGVANVWLPLMKIHGLLYYWVTTILSYIAAFAAPAAVIIAVKSILTMAKEK